MKKTKGQLPPFMNAVAQGTIKDPVYGIFIGGKGNKGEITFGGVNEHHLEAKTMVKTKIVAGDEIVIQMDKLVFGGVELCKKGANCKALIDTGCSSFWGPAASVGKYLAGFGE